MSFLHVCLPHPWQKSGSSKSLRQLGFSRNIKYHQTSPLAELNVGKVRLQWLFLFKYINWIITKTIKLSLVRKKIFGEVTSWNGDPRPPFPINFFPSIFWAKKGDFDGCLKKINRGMNFVRPPPLRLWNYFTKKYFFYEWWLPSPSSLTTGGDALLVWWWQWW